MNSTSSARRAWRGGALIAVAALHGAFTIVVGSTAHDDPKFQQYLGTESPWAGLHPGFGADLPPRLWLLSLVWSLFFGATLALLGALVHSVEHRGVTIPRPFSIALLGVALLGVVLMPVSGFWCVALIALAMAWRP